MMNPALPFRRTFVLSHAAALACGALLPAAAHAASTPTGAAHPGALLTLGVGLLLLLLRPAASQPAHELFARDLDAQPSLPEPQRSPRQLRAPRQLQLSVQALS